MSSTVERMSPLGLASAAISQSVWPGRTVTVVVSGSAPALSPARCRRAEQDHQDGDDRERRGEDDSLAAAGQPNGWCGRQVGNGDQVAGRTKSCGSGCDRMRCCSWGASVGEVRRCVLKLVRSSEPCSSMSFDGANRRSIEHMYDIRGRRPTKARICRTEFRTSLFAPCNCRQNFSDRRGDARDPALTVEVHDHDSVSTSSPHGSRRRPIRLPCWPPESRSTRSCRCSPR